MNPNTTSTKLPDDLAQCHALICELLAVKDELAASMRQQELEKARLLARVEHLLRQMYGRSAEKIDPAQLLLFAAEAMAAVEAQAPQTEVPGTKMSFAGLRASQDRVDLIAYLRMQSDHPLPIPPKQ